MAVERRALLVGVSAYGVQNADLPAVETDLDDLADALRHDGGPDFEVAIVGTRTGQSSRYEIMTSVQQFFDKAELGDYVNLLYFACHGLLDTQQELHLVPSDYEPSNLAATGIPVSFLAPLLPNVGASVIILDCCFAAAGVWRLVYGKRAIFEVPQDQVPDYCLIAAARRHEPAGDGAFTPALADAIRSLDPDPQLGFNVGIEPILGYVTRRLQATHLQVPRLWQSTSLAIPIGRRIARLRARREAIPSLYECAPHLSLVAPVSPNRFRLDFLERQETALGFAHRTGIRVLEGEVTREDLLAAYADVTSAVDADEIDHGVVVLSDIPEGEVPSTDRVQVKTFMEFRSAILPIVGYLERWVEEYENRSAGVHRRQCYVSVRAHFEGSREQLALDTVILDWTESSDEPFLLLALAEFGAGKTTTAEYVFWRQVLRYLSSPEKYRIPIFVRLRDYDKMFSIDTLVDKSFRSARASGLTFTAVEELNRQGRILWILDGFDEMAVRVTEPVMHRNFRELLRLAAPRARMLLTSRTAFFKSREEMDDVVRGTELFGELEELGKSQYKVLFGDGFGEDDIETFVRARIGEEADQFLGVLRGSSEIQNLATRPILLEMIVISLPEIVKRGEEPNLARLYEIYTTRLLRRDAWRFTIEIQKDRVRFCETLAWHFFVTSIYEISYRELPSFVKKCFPSYAREAEEFDALNRAIQVTSFLSRDSSNFSFAHKSFLEYFAASHIATSLSSGKLELLSEKVVSGEVVKFLGQMVDGRSIRSQLEMILEKSDISVGYLMNKYLRPRLIPVLSKSGATSYVQRGWRHRFVHMALPVIALFSGVTYLAVARWDPFFRSVGSVPFALMASDLLFLGFAVLFAFSLIHSCIYLFKAIRGHEGDPVMRFNALASIVASGEGGRRRQLEKLVDQLPMEERQTATLVVLGAGPVAELQSGGLTNRVAAGELASSNTSEVRAGCTYVGFPVALSVLWILASMIGEEVWSDAAPVDEWWKMGGVGGVAGLFAASLNYKIWSLSRTFVVIRIFVFALLYSFVWIVAEVMYEGSSALLAAFISWLLCTTDLLVTAAMRAARSRAAVRKAERG